MSKNVLIVYYSHSKNTEKLAKLIQQQTGGTLLKIKPEIPYPEDYDTVVAQAKKEITSNYHPVLSSKIDNIEMYNMIFVGTPNWWSTIAPPIATILDSYDLSGKTVIPFCTHGGGGFGHIESDIKKICSNSNILPGLATYRSSANDTEVSEWVRKIGIEK